MLCHVIAVLLVAVLKSVFVIVFLCLPCFFHFTLPATVARRHVMSQEVQWHWFLLYGEHRCFIVLLYRLCCALLCFIVNSLFLTYSLFDCILFMFRVKSQSFHSRRSLDWYADASKLIWTSTLSHKTGLWSCSGYTWNVSVFWFTCSHWRWLRVK